MIAVAALVVTVSVGAYAHYENYSRRGGWMQYGAQNPQMEPQQGGMYSSRGHKMYGHWGGMMYGPGYKGNVTPENCPCGGGYGWNAVRSGWNAQNQQQRTVPQIVTEEQAKTAAEEYIQKYLSSYTVENIEKDSWRPLYFVTIKDANEVEQQMVIHGFNGQVMHVFPKTTE